METLWLFVAAFGASALGSVLGMASSIFIVPILTLPFGVDIHAAIGASLVSVIACMLMWQRCPIPEKSLD
jgi:uncharacterized membrane protein YfcA